eukprot:gene948-2588_t
MTAAEASPESAASPPPEAPPAEAAVEQEKPDRCTLGMMTCIPAALSTTPAPCGPDGQPLRAGLLRHVRPTQIAVASAKHTHATPSF